VKSAAEPVVPTSIRCQNCKKSLRVPDALIGKQIKCPGCGHAFVAEPPEEEPTSVVEIDEEAESERQGGAPPTTPIESSASALEDDEEVADDSAKTPAPGKKARRQRALSAARLPAIALLTVGGIGLALAVLNLGLLFSGTGPLRPRTPPPNPNGAVVLHGPMAQAQQRAYEQIYPIVTMIVSVAFVLWGVIVLLGGYFLYQLKSWSTVMFAAIVAMLPCHLCCLLGLPFGIWTLVVINRPEVKSAFEA
jgi:phage FluMu protein Com